MKIIVITGSTRGIGFGLAKAFLSQGCFVVISGRTPTSLDKAYTALSEQYSPEKILAVPCNVGNFEEVQSLWDSAKSHFGKVDIWINNAAISHPRYPVWQQTPEKIKEVLETNLIGSIYGSKVAIEGMLTQGFGAVYNLEGSGSSGSKLRYLTLYGTSKYGIRFLTESLVKETKGTPVIVGFISPGIVVTDLVTKQYDETQQDFWQKTKRILNIIADQVETVTPWLAQQILKNEKTGVRIAWLTIPKVIRRFLLSPFRKRELFGFDPPNPPY